MPPGEGVCNRPVPRLAHKKSRTGCQRCRARRVKCDETHPVCRSCQRHNVPCFYDHDVPTARGNRSEGSETYRENATSDRSSTVTTPTTSMIKRPPESRETRILELRLLHQFTKRTSSDILVSHPTEGKYIWSTECPRLAFDHDSVLYTMFALAALHIAKADPIWPYAEAMNIHRRYLDLALPTHSEDVAHLTRANADAACLSSTLLRICAFAYLAERPVEPYTPPLQWLQMTSAAVRVFHATWDWIQDESAPLAHKLLSQPPKLSPFNESLFLASNRQGFEHLVTHSNPMEPWDADIDHAYKVAVSYIGSILVAIATGEERGTELCRRVIGFPMLVHPRFVTLVEEKQPRALVVLAHYFALVARFRGLWWMGDSGRKEVRGIQTVVPAEWQEAMRWPLESIADDKKVIMTPEQKRV